MPDRTQREGSILVMGEAILDVFETPDRQQVEPEKALGGSSFITALALGRLGVPAAFAGALSRDADGQRFAESLAEAAVDLRWCVRSDAPTPVARATPLADGSTRYAFALDATAHDEPYIAMTPWPTQLTHLHVSSFRCILGEHGRDSVAAMKEARVHATVSFDPNIRSPLLPSPRETVDLITAHLGCADIVKASEEDIAWLHPGMAIEEVARLWYNLGAALVVVTCGAHGVYALWRDGDAQVDAPHITPVDTVGAGDAFTAGLLAAMHREGALGPGRNATMTADSIARWLEHATRVAAIVCGRRGGNPPWAREV